MRAPGTPTPKAMLAQEERRLVNGIATYSRTVGEGEDVVLVHGVGVSARYWAPLQEELAATGRFRVHAVDLPGFGQSADPPWQPELPRYAEHLRGWLDQAVPGRFHLVGQSLGCEIAAMCAATCPERIRSLTLAGPSGLPTLRSLAAQLGRALLDAPREPLRLYRVIVPDYLRCGLWRMLLALLEQKRYHVAELLADLRLPTLLIRGEGDTVVTAERLAAIAKALPYARTAEAPGAHGAHFTHARVFAAVLAPFLAAPTAAVPVPACSPAPPAGSPAGSPAPAPPWRDPTAAATIHRRGGRSRSQPPTR